MLTSAQHAVDSADAAQHAVDSADAALAFVNVGPGEPRHRLLVEKVATGILSADQAVEETVAHFGLALDRSARPQPTDFEDYTLPGTLALRSRLVDDARPDGIDDAETLSAVERELSRIRILELQSAPLVKTFDYDHLKSIHRFVFGDVYHWAGQERVGPESAMIRFAPETVGFAPGDPAAPMVKYSYFAGPDIADAASVQCAQLSHLATRTDLTRRRFFDLIAEYAGELNVIHPFRDGNLRALWIFAAQLEDQVGYPIDVAGFLKEAAAHQLAMHAAYHFQATNDHDTMFRLMEAGLSQVKTESEAERRD